MKIKNIAISSIVALAFSSCYEDLGNYDYKDINEITVAGIESNYAVDLDDMLEITPVFEGTLYSDTTKFTYEWVIDGVSKAQTHDLNIQVDFGPGEIEARYTITDKESGVKAYTDFDIRVSSSTAGDLYMILSKYKGKAELSYLRLDKESNFAVNYYEARNGVALGTTPQQLTMFDYKSTSTYVYPFSNGYGRVIALVDNRAYLFDKHDLEMDSTTNYLTGETYTGISSYPPANIEGYQTQYSKYSNTMWRELVNGTQQESGACYEISGGAVYGISVTGNYLAYTARYYNIKTPYNDNVGTFSPFWFYDTSSDAPDSYPWVMGLDVGNVMVFDETAGKFAFIYYGSAYSTDIKSFEGYELMYGSDTNNNDQSFAVLRNGEVTRLVLIDRESGTSYSSSAYSAGGEVVTTGIITSETDFYTMKYSSYVYFVTGNKIYCYNLLDAGDNIAPSEKNLVATLTDYGYDSDAVIKSLCVSRSERTMLLGVSRYGSDTEANDDEIKGDLVEISLDASTLKLTYKNTYTGVCGIPVDVEVKYQTHYRNGIGQDGTYVDTI